MVNYEQNTSLWKNSNRVRRHGGGGGGGEKQNIFSGFIYGDREVPRNYYDPQIMLAEKSFQIKPMEEILIIINGSGYRFSDDTVYPLEFRFVNENPIVPTSSTPSQKLISTAVPPDNTTTTSTTKTNDKSPPPPAPPPPPPTTTTTTTTDHSGSKNNVSIIKDSCGKNSMGDLKPSLGSGTQLCCLVKNCSTTFTIYVGYKSPLHWLLDLPRIQSKLCYCSIADITKCRLYLNWKNDNNDDDDDDDDNDEMQMQPKQQKSSFLCKDLHQHPTPHHAEDKTIVIRYC